MGIGHLAHQVVDEGLLQIGQEPAHAVAASSRAIGAMRSSVAMNSSGSAGHRSMFESCDRCRPCAAANAVLVTRLRCSSATNSPVSITAHLHSCASVAVFTQIVKRFVSSPPTPTPERVLVTPVRVCRMAPVRAMGTEKGPRRGAGGPCGELLLDAPAARPHAPPYQHVIEQDSKDGLQ